MKLHLPTAFRNAVLASLASISIPAVTLGSGAVAAELQPTLTKLHQQAPDVYPNDSSYQLIEVTENEANSFCSYDISKDGSLVPHYYKCELKPEAYANKLANAAELIATVSDKSYQWTVGSNGALSLQPDGADIKYSTNADAEGRHLFFNGNTELGTTNGDATLNFHWEWEEFGTAENDGRNPQKSDHRWSFKKGAGEAGISYTYSTDENKSYQEIAQGENADKVDGVFVGNERLVEKILTEDLKEALDTKEIIFGGAIANNGSVTSISADFVDNSVQSRFYTEKDLCADLTATNIAAGGAIYNATEGTIQLINGNFIGNFAYVNISALSGMNDQSKSSAILMEGAMGGAIYNEGSLGDIIGNFIGNYAKIERAMLPSFYIKSDAYNSSIAILAMGGAIYNSNSIDSITGNFVSNNVYNEHHTSIGYPYVGSNPEIQSSLTTYAAGGAIYNGILNHNEINSNVTASIGSISGIFVDNFVYNVSTFMLDPKNGTFAPGGAGDCFSDARHHAFGGAIYNGLAGIENSNEAYSASIDSIEGEFTGNYAHMKNYASRLSTLSNNGSGFADQISLMRSYAFGGAIYNGVDYITESGSISAVINYIGGDFSGNYAFANRITKLDESTDKNYAFGGAIYNGAADISANAAQISSEITLINADFVGNYARVYDNGREFTSIAAGGAINNSIADIFNNSGEILSSIESITGKFVDNEVIADALPEAGVGSKKVIYNLAAGGAIANEIVDIESNNNTITSSIKSIDGEFIGNKAHNFFENTNFNDSSSVESGSIVSNYAMGGAISNSVEIVSDNSGTITSLIDSITGSFINNVVYTERGTTPDYASNSSNGKMYAMGGALANANLAISGNSGKIHSNIVSIVGEFIENYVSSQEEALGGAVYNGNREITDNAGEVTAEIGSIIGDFTKNYAFAKSARGGAIYNGNNSISNNAGSIIARIGKITGDFVENCAEANIAAGDARGGAIYNSLGEIGAITGDFVGNHAGHRDHALGTQSYGGAIFNVNASIGDIVGNFTGNYAYSNENATGHAYAGAIYNIYNNSADETHAKIGQIDGDFIGNYAEGAASAEGGAIVNGGTTEYAEIGPINGSFINNHAKAGSSSAVGGAIRNSGTFGDITGDFIRNFAESNEGNAEGGAIANLGIFHTITGDFIENHASILANSDNVAYGGAISNAGHGIIETLHSDFTRNYAQSTTSTAYGGAIYNVHGTQEGWIGVINGNFTENHATGRTAAEGGAIYNYSGDINTINGDFVHNYTQATDLSPTSGSYGGAIFNANQLRSSVSPRTCTIGSINGNFIGNYAKNVNGFAWGGAIMNDFSNVTNAAIIGTINGNFIQNYAESETYYARGGAISNLKVINTITGDFIGNYAVTHAANTAYAQGGAIHNMAGAASADNILGRIDTIVGNFIENYVESNEGPAAGGALFNGSFATIHSITGSFIDNHATSLSGTAQGGAVVNMAQIGWLKDDASQQKNLQGQLEYDGSIDGGFFHASFIGNLASSDSGEALGGAIYTASDLFITENRHSSHAYFTENTAASARSAIYVASSDASVYLVVSNNSHLHIDDAISGAQGYVLRLRGFGEKSDAHKDTTGTIYLNHLVEHGNAIMDDVNLYIGYAETSRAWQDLDGDGSTSDGKNEQIEDTLLRTLGNDVTAGHTSYLDSAGVTQTPAADFARAHHLSGVFANAELTVRSGTVFLTDYDADSEAYTEYVFGGLTAYGADYNYADHGATAKAVKDAYQGDLADPFNAEKNLFADFAFGVNMNTEGMYKMEVSVKGDGQAPKTETRQMAQSDILTVFAKENADGSLDMDSTAKGRITLHSLSINALDRGWMFTKRPYTDVDPDDPNRDPDNRGDEFNRDVYVQLINFVLLDAAGNVVTDAGKLSDFYAQFDTNDNLLRLTDHFDLIDDVAAYVKSSQILASGIELATTKTKDDSIRITDYRDLLAEWAEHQGTWDGATYNDDGSIKETANKNDMKKFELEGVYYLNRDINIKDNPTTEDHSSTSAAMWGNDLEIFSTNAGGKIDLQGLNLLHLITAPQKVTLRNFSLVGVQNNTMENLGHLKLDSMHMESNLTVNNQGELTITGSTDIDYTITAVEKELDELGNLKTGSGDKKIATGKKMTIEHSTGTGVAQSVTRIFNTVEYQNIDHRGNKNDLQLAQTDGVWAIAGNWADAFDSVTYLNTTREDGVTTTKAFDQFKMNELNMHGGAFALGAMHTNRLQLRNFTIQGGGVFVDSSTIDIAKGKEVMGGIDVISGGTAKYGSSASTGDTAYEPRAASANSGTGNGLIWLQSFTLANSSDKPIIHVKFVDPGVADAVKDGMGVANGGEPSGAVNMEDGDHIWIWQVTYNDEKAPQKGMYTLVRGDATTPGGPGGPGGNPTTPEVNDGAVSDLVGSYVSMMQVYNYAFEHADLYSASLYQARRQDFYSKHNTVVTPTKNGKGAESPEVEASCRPALARMGSGLWLQTYASTETMPLRNGPHVRNEMYGALLGTDSNLIEHRNGWVSVYSLYGGYLGSTQRYQSVRIRQNGGALGGTATFYKERFYTALTATIGTSSAAATGRYGHEDYDLFMGGIASRTGYNIELDDEGDYILQPTLLVSYSCFSASDYTNASGVKMDSRPVGTLQFHPYLKLISNKDCKWKPYATLGYVHDVMGKTKFRANGMHLPSMGIRPYVEYSIGTQYLWSDAYTIYAQIIGRNGGRNGMEANLGLRWSW